MSIRPVQVVFIKRRTPIAPSPLAARTFRAPMSMGEIATAIATVKDRARHMHGVSRTNPHLFAEEKGELVADLAQLEDAVRKGTPLPARLKQEGA